jgi:hypothetical protein
LIPRDGASPATDDQLVPRQWALAEVSESLNCRRCGYDLRGLRADGKCPECGLHIWATVLSTIDPAASRLPSLRNPRAVGNAMLVLSACVLAGALLMVAPGVQSVIGVWDTAQAKAIARWIPAFNWAWAIVVGVCGLWSVWMLAPPTGSEPQGAVWKDLWRIGTGLVGWLTFASIWWHSSYAGGRFSWMQDLVMNAATAGFAVYGLIGLRGVFDIIGRRSREYWRSQTGRQSLDLISVAITVGVAASVAVTIRRLFAPYATRNDTVLMLSGVVLWMSTLMVVIGLGYLVLNAWWIRRTLRRPPPPLDELLMPKLATDTVIPDQEE